MTSTIEIKLNYFLHRPKLSRNVDWAVSMLEQGHDSQHLRILAGEIEPHNRHEIIRFTKAAFNELGFELVTGPEILVEYTGEVVADYIRGDISTGLLLDKLCSICIEAGYESQLYDFYSLYFAYEQVKSGYSDTYWGCKDYPELKSEVIRVAYEWIEDHKPNGE